MPVDPRLREQVHLILGAHEDAAVFPDDWERTGEVNYLYEKDAILSYTRDVTRVIESLNRNFPVGEEEAGAGSRYVLSPVSPAVSRIQLLGLPPVPVVLDALDADAEVGEPGTCRINGFLYTCPYPCPATEPMEVPWGAAPFPSYAWDSPCRHPGHACDGEGVSVSIVDTGLLPDAAEDHPWLAGVTGTPEHAYYPGTDQIRPYAGHGTFVAGCLCCMAPEATVFVVKGFDSGIGAFESDLAPVLEAALDAGPGIFVFTFVTETRHDLSLKTFDDLYERRISHIPGLVVITPAGNDGTSRRMWPAAYRWVVSVGALSESWRHRADFSNYGVPGDEWVDVYTPGQDLVNAFAVGHYTCDEWPHAGEHRHFDGMAMWSGTSFSTPIFAGLVAARMSGSGENGQQAAASLLQLAQSQLVDGTYPALYPGQACPDQEGT
jgi:subtilisin family serine protease